MKTTMKDWTESDWYFMEVNRLYLDRSLGKKGTFS